MCWRACEHPRRRCHQGRGGPHPVVVPHGHLRGVYPDTLTREQARAQLGISPRTAKAHCDVLRQKLGVPRRRQIPAAYRALTGDDPLAHDLGAEGRVGLGLALRGQRTDPALEGVLPRLHHLEVALQGGDELQQALEILRVVFEPCCDRRGVGAQVASLRAQRGSRHPCPSREPSDRQLDGPPVMRSNTAVRR